MKKCRLEEDASSHVASVDVAERLARLEALMENSAMKDDLERVHSNMLKWTVGTILTGLVAAGAIVALIDEAL